MSTVGYAKPDPEHHYSIIWENVDDESVTMMLRSVETMWQEPKDVYEHLRDEFCEFVQDVKKWREIATDYLKVG